MKRREARQAALFRQFDRNVFRFLTKAVKSPRATAQDRAIIEPVRQHLRRQIVKQGVAKKADAR